MININNITKNFTGRTLFKDVSLSIFPSEKIGLTGPNGSGKSTLFSMILGDMESTEGQIQVQKNLNIGFLPQEAKFDSKRTVIEELTSGDTRIAKLMDEKHELEEANKADGDRYGDVLHELEQMGVYELEHKAEKILMGLGFKPEDFHKPVITLSGGWQMRTLLAKLLTYPYDLLLLDEPTNHLDLEATLWLKDFLAGYRGTFILISHDKLFLNDVTNYTIILENGRMAKIKGNYGTYETDKGVRNKTMEKQHKVIEKRKEQLEKFTQRFHAQPNRASAVRNKRKMLERLNDQLADVEIPDERRSIKDFEFPPTRRSGEVVATLTNVSKAYGEKVVYQGLDFEITRGQKICLVGPNGAGKSTLLKMVGGIVDPDTGTRKLGLNVDLGYFSQTRLDVLNPERTAFEEVAAAGEGGIPALRIRTLLGLFNFRGDDVFKPVRVLSGGEKSRLILAKLLINPPNFILLDEPTTHLDIDGVEALTECFQAYEGTLCFISHDLFFVKEIANHVIEVNHGVLRNFPGGLDYYLEKKKESDQEANQEGKRKKEDERRQKAKEEKAKETFEETDLHRQHKQALDRLAQIKKEIKDLEREREVLDQESYAKSRVLSQSFHKSSMHHGRDPEMLKEYGQRLKWIQKRLRDIDSTIKQLGEEHDRINK